jgi:hypothetical protein
MILDRKGFQIVVYLNQPYSVHAKRIKMTQEAIQRQIESLRRAHEMTSSPEANHQFLVDAGIIKAKAPAKKKKTAKRKTK